MIFFIIICKMINWSIRFGNQFSNLIWISWWWHFCSNNFFSCSNRIQSIQNCFLFRRILNWSFSSLLFFESSIWTKVFEFNRSWAKRSMNRIGLNLLLRAKLCLWNHCDSGNWLYWLGSWSFFKSSICCILKNIKSLLSKRFIDCVIVSVNEFNCWCFPKEGKHGYAHCNFVHLFI